MKPRTDPTTCYTVYNLLAFNPVEEVGDVEETILKLRINRLNKEPKNRAITVQVSVMTLYGILKSGVGRLTKSVSV